MSWTYDPFCYIATSSVLADERAWEWMKFVSASLKASTLSPWVTIGSSCDGSSGTAFSATPDGVDRWAGKTMTQAATAGVPTGKTIWNILENVATGLQVCLTYIGSGLNHSWGFSVNKFNSAGAWRGGGTNANTRPTDTASSPAAGREVFSSVGAMSYAGVAAQIYRLNLVNRSDGMGFYTYFFPDSGVSAASISGLVGVLRETAPQPETVNPYLLLCTDYTGVNGALLNQGATPSTGTGRLTGRKGAAGTLCLYGCLQPGAASSLFTSLPTLTDDLDPVLTAYPLFPSTAYSNVPAGNAHLRSGLPNLYMANGTLSPDFNTWNSKAYIQIGFAVVPYDPAKATPRGTDRTGYLFSLDGDIQLDQTYSIIDPKRFNGGLEKI